jgi:hypothetical protein
MTAWVEIPPLDRRVADCRVCCRILDVLAREATSLRSIKSMHRLDTLIGSEYSTGEVRQAAYMLQNADLITATTEGEKGAMKNPILTALGWTQTAVPKPFWMVEH